MRAIVLNRNNPSGLELTTIQQPKVGAGQVRVAIKATSLNHRDEWCRKGQYANLKDGVVLGSDASGVVTEIGEGVGQEWKGKEVIINPASNWGDDQRFQSKDFQILGMPENGTLSESIVVSLNRVYPKPAHLSWEEAAALPLAGVTAFRAMFFRGKLKKGENLIVTGFGGGVAQFATQFGLAFGANVFVSSSDDEKLAKAQTLGVKAGFKYTHENWVEKAVSSTGGFDLIIDGAAGNALSNLIDVCKPGGRIVFYGATLGDPDVLTARKVFWKQLNIMGSTMGSDQDFDEMVNFVSNHQIRPIVDKVFPFEEAENAFDRMREGKQMGKIVLVP